MLSETTDAGQTSVSWKRVQFFVKELFHQKFSVSNFELILLVKLFDQSAQQGCSTILQVYYWTNDRLCIEVALKREIHQDRNHSLERLIEVVEGVGHNSFQNSKQLVDNCNVTRRGILLHLKCFGLYKLNEVRQQVDEIRLGWNLWEEFCHLHV